jgi:hypothetical protein
VGLGWYICGFEYGVDFFQNVYDRGMDSIKKELWERLANEPERTYRAFESFLTLSSGERTILAAYRSYVGNPDATKPSDTWSGWSSQFAWRERALAYDDHLASLRRDAYERGIEEEAERHGAAVERTRNRMHELLTRAYEKAVERLEHEDFAEALRPQEIIQIVKLHIEVAEKFAVGAAQEGAESTWTEEDDADFRDILKEMEAQSEAYQAMDEDLEEGSEDDSEETG